MLQLMMEGKGEEHALGMRAGLGSFSFLIFRRACSALSIVRSLRSTYLRACKQPSVSDPYVAHHLTPRAIRLIGNLSIGISKSVTLNQLQLQGRRSDLVAST